MIQHFSKDYSGCQDYSGPKADIETPVRGLLSNPGRVETATPVAAAEMVKSCLLLDIFEGRVNEVSL